MVCVAAAGAEDEPQLPEEDRFLASARTDAERIGDHVRIYKTPASPFWQMQWSCGGQQFRRSLHTSSKKQAQPWVEADPRMESPL